MNKAEKLLQQAGIFPAFPAAPGTSGKAGVDDNVHILEGAVKHIFKAQEYRFHGQAGKGLVDMDEVVTEGFMKMARKESRSEACPNSGAQLPLSLYDRANLPGEPLDLPEFIRRERRYSL